MIGESVSILKSAIRCVLSLPVAFPIVIVGLGWVSMELDARAWTSFEMVGDLRSIGAQLASEPPELGMAASTLTFAERIASGVSRFLGRAAFVTGALAIFLSLAALRRGEIPWPMRAVVFCYAIYCVVQPLVSIR